MQFIIKLFIVLIPVVVFLFCFPHVKNKTVFILAVLVLSAFSAIAIFRVGKEAYVNYHQPPEWDFLTFWLDGKVALTGENFYEVKNYQEMPLPYNPSGGFMEEIIDVGFRYPPFTMLLFLPLGLFDISNAYLLWQISNLLLCVACIYGLWRLFLKDYGIFSLLLVATLMLWLVPTRYTFSVAQTNFLALLFFLLFLRNRSKPWGGVWLALCVVVKPYMAILYIYPLLTRKWKVLAIAILTLLALTFLSVLAFGSEVLISFLHNPTPDMPGYVYTEGVNQSLLATILRLTPNQIIKESPILNPLYLGISLLFSLITVWVTIKKNSSHDWVILSILFLALIIYPASLAHYGVFLIIPVVLLLRQSSKNAKQKMAVCFMILITYFLSGYNSGIYVFYANLFMWLVCIVLGANLNLYKFSKSQN